MTNSHYEELQSQEREKIDDTQMEGQANNKEPTLVDITTRTEERPDKLEITSNKVDELETIHKSLEKRFNEDKSAQDFICNKFHKQEKKMQKLRKITKI